jgi:hypothetical protein
MWQAREPCAVIFRHPQWADVTHLSRLPSDTTSTPHRTPRVLAHERQSSRRPACSTAHPSPRVRLGSSARTRRQGRRHRTRLGDAGPRPPTQRLGRHRRAPAPVSKAKARAVPQARAEAGAEGTHGMGCGGVARRRRQTTTTSAKGVGPCAHSASTSEGATTRASCYTITRPPAAEAWGGGGGPAEPQDRRTTDSRPRAGRGAARAVERPKQGIRKRSVNFSGSLGFRIRGRCADWTRRHAPTITGRTQRQA